MKKIANDLTKSATTNDHYFRHGYFHNTFTTKPGELETINRDTRSPYEIGNTSHFRETQVLLRILSNNDSVSSRIADFITDQKETSIQMFDTEKVAMSGYYPLNYDGTLNFQSGYHSYLSANLPYDKIKNSNVFIKDAFSEDLNYITPNLCKVTVRLNIESVTR